MVTSEVGLNGVETAIDVRGVEAGYGDITVLRDIDFSLQRGSVVAVIGANGAGKTTLLKVIAGLVRTTKGSVSVGGKDVTRAPAHKRGEVGLCLIPEGRGIFRTLSVRDNLRLFNPPGAKQDIEPAVASFPVLGKRLNQLAGTLSGGEQQMLALARAYLAKPQIILVDELSLGLAPVLVDDIFASVRSLASAGVTLVIVEQYVDKVLEFADAAHILVRGRIDWQGPAKDVDQELLAASYLGGAA